MIYQDAFLYKSTLEEELTNPQKNIEAIEDLKRKLIKTKGFLKQVRLTILNPQFVTLDTLHDFKRYCTSAQLPTYDQYIYALYDEPYTHDYVELNPFTPTEEDYYTVKYEPSEWVKEHAASMIDADGMCSYETLQPYAEQRWQQETSLTPFYEASRLQDLQGSWTKPLAELERIRQEDDEIFELNRTIKELHQRLRSQGRDILKARNKIKDLEEIIIELNDSKPTNHGKI